MKKQILSLFISIIIPGLIAQNHVADRPLHDETQSNIFKGLACITTGYLSGAYLCVAKYMHKPKFAAATTNYRSFIMHVAQQTAKKNPFTLAILAGSSTAAVARSNALKELDNKNNIN